ncbi:MAG: hypothetical protein KME25_03915 [Symplocastrum torsivum CPER-KK1]|uniref:Antitoxin SocA-like Panacea domain-containing protein n=1 Tax=Symplocastrum torsivum CPER-KK1 TaxID=450513 RepID=A0A951U8B7_9CYAN|nr:hypothetical protein [Symplocastrum torsivum CPER-KK1]
MYDEPLFDEEIQAWRYGPVCPPAYRFYSLASTKEKCVTGSTPYLIEQSENFKRSFKSDYLPDEGDRIV